jgi:parallel beta-helix repeat protein
MIANNAFTNEGIFIFGSSLSHYCHNIGKNNLVNGKPIYYFRNQSGLNIDGWEVGQIFLVNCSNFFINKVNTSNTEVGIELAYSTNIVIKNSIFSNNDKGIHLYSCNSNTISNNNIHSNNGRGILMQYSILNTVSNNSISNNNYGIYLDHSRLITVMNNSISNNKDGTTLYGSRSNTITNNKINSNKNNGIDLGSSSSNTITDNIISNNDCGIFLDHSSSHNKIHYNDIFNNIDFGICVEKIDFPVNATSTYNWWGDTSGPYHQVNNTAGKGDDVTDYVEFEPWLTAPTNIIKPLEDTDSDGVINLWDEDDDNDGWNDTIEQLAGSNLLDNSSVPLDTDDDCIPDELDPDIDDDGVPNDEDGYPYDENKWKKKKAEVDHTMLYLGIIILVTILVIIFTIFMRYKGKSPKEQFKEERIDPKRLKKINNLRNEKRKGRSLVNLELRTK